MYGKYIVFQKIGGEETYAGEFYSRVQIFDKLFEEVPELSDPEGVRLLPVDNPENFPLEGNSDTQLYPLNVTR